MDECSCCRKYLAKFLFTFIISFSFFLAPIVHAQNAGVPEREAGQGTACPKGEPVSIVSSEHCGDKDGAPAVCEPCVFCGDGIVLTPDIVLNPNAVDPTLFEDCEIGVDGRTAEDCVNCRNPECGDEIINTDRETCDPPGVGGCRDNCTKCGDDNLDEDRGETCEPPGSIQSNGKICTNSCTYCGDGNKDPGEACDDGNTDNNDGCREDCTKCGDGTTDPDWGETCDGGPDCTSICTSCGDGKRNHPTELCDGTDFGLAPGIQADPLGRTCGAPGEDNACNYDPYCGDEDINDDETCDPPGEVQANGKECKAGCFYCGDGNKNPGEFCDDDDFGPDGKPFPEAVCNDSCDGTTHDCGDGNVTGRETCDVATDDECRPEICNKCGDGTRDEDQGEFCDGSDFGPDGPPFAGAECNESCTDTTDKCGNGDVDLDFDETCDPPGERLDNGQRCRRDCTHCGDGNKDDGEFCDGDDFGPEGKPFPEAECNISCNDTTHDCGDGDVTGDETCDINDPATRDGCRPGVCTKCGDGNKDEGEFCDGDDFGPDGKPFPEAECNASCDDTTHDCGDGDVTGEETCDIATDSECRPDVCNKCGDDKKNADEFCDGDDFGPDGPPFEGAECNANCTDTTDKCGNGDVEPELDETCDPPLSAQSNGNLCSSECKYCGDGNRDPGEYCDGDDFGPDGKPFPAAVCDNSCEETTHNCGDGEVAGRETCDIEDPATKDGCRPEVCNKCGDGTRDEDEGEFCDGDDFGPDGPPFEGAVCNASCDDTTHDCGDGEVTGDETCDIATDDKCRPEICNKCGDGTRDEDQGEICDGDDFGPDGKPFPEAVCNDSCDGTTNLCGNGTVDFAEGETCDINDPRTQEGCRPEVCTKCGDDIRDEDQGEVCDWNDFGPDGPPFEGAMCDDDCSGPMHLCGDGDITGDETCDVEDPATKDGCRPEVCNKCGDGTRDEDEGEICDGDDFGPDGKPFPEAVCNDSCDGTTNLCGNGSVDFAEGETCDINDPRTQEGCRPEVCTKCGDDIRDEDQGEFCDWNDFGPEGPPFAGAKCLDDCSGPMGCGDGLRNGDDEDCDGSDFGLEDGVQTSDTLSCDDSCKISEDCGNGLREEGEECDGSDFGLEDGVQSNVEAGLDAETTCGARGTFYACRIESRCGDGKRNRLQEQCDGTDFGFAAGIQSAEESGYPEDVECYEAGHAKECKTKDYCGDGDVTGEETCDINDPATQDGCRPGVCTRCGDDKKNHGEYCDGDDFGGPPPYPGAECNDSCDGTKIACGDGLRNRLFELCDGSDFGRDDGVQSAESQGLPAGIECFPAGHERECRPGNYCGDRERGAGEECDRDDFGLEPGRQGPESQGLPAETQCNPAGHENECQTAAICGDNERSVGEDCDGSDFGLEEGEQSPEEAGLPAGMTCHTTGALKCKTKGCGDGRLDLGDGRCDGGDFFFLPGVQSPESVGLPAGTICNPAGHENECQPGPICGDGNRDLGEDCDGSDFGLEEGTQSPEDVDLPAGITCHATGALKCKTKGCGDGRLDLGDGRCDGGDFFFLPGVQSPESIGLSPETRCNPAGHENECDLAELCGDGKRDSDEDCDGSDFGLADGPQSAEDSGYPAGAQCTPKGEENECKIANVCGDGKRDAGEDCDGSDFGLEDGVQTNVQGGYDDSAICIPVDQEGSCTIDKHCGNGIVDRPGEECDGSDFSEAEGVQPHPLGADCHAADNTDKECTVEAHCGDGSRNTGREECDGNDFGEEDGEQTNVDAGCDNNAECIPPGEEGECTLTAHCGNGIRDAGEDCDGPDFGEAEGVQPHPLGATCHPADDSPKQCTVEPHCGDERRNEGEDCDDKDFGLADGVQSPEDEGLGAEATCYAPGHEKECQVPPHCGDSNVDEGERCDPGADPDCRDNCTKCGDGLRDVGEDCDQEDFGLGDGVQEAEQRGDRCTDACVLDRCTDEDLVTIDVAGSASIDLESGASRCDTLTTVRGIYGHYPALGDSSGTEYDLCSSKKDITFTGSVNLPLIIEKAETVELEYDPVTTIVNEVGLLSDAQRNEIINRLDDVLDGLAEIRDRDTVTTSVGTHIRTEQQRLRDVIDYIGNMDLSDITDALDSLSDVVSQETIDRWKDFVRDSIGTGADRGSGCTYGTAIGGYLATYHVEAKRLGLNGDPRCWGLEDLRNFLENGASSSTATLNLTLNPSSITGSYSSTVGADSQEYAGFVCASRAYNHWLTIARKYQARVNDSRPVKIKASNRCGDEEVTVNFNAAGEYEYAYYSGELCGNYTPISIELVEGAFEATLPTTVKFKLAEKQEGEVLWYGSEATPLLVWDEKRTGQIKDGKQLFGGWSFGKKWANGYDALAVLDENKDKYLTGEELVGIRLWADANRNGVSEPGEVKDLSDYGIVKLATYHDGQDEIPLYGVKFLTSDKGAYVKKGDKESTLRSIDWITTSVDKETWEENLSNLRKDGYEVYEYVESPVDKSSQNKNSINGYLIYKETAGGIVSGWHVSALEYDNNGKFDSYSTSATELNGTTGDGLIVINTEVDGRFVNYDIEIKAKNDLESKGLKGESLKVVVTDKGTGKGSHELNKGVKIQKIAKLPRFLK